MRHGQASDPRLAATDAQRHLTKAGRVEAVAMAWALRDAGFVPTHIYTSPLVRAVQTAEAVAYSLAFEGPIPARAALVPGGKTADAMSILDEHSDEERVLLVSHEPTVRVVSGHLGGVQLPPFPTAGVAIFDVGESVTLRGRMDPRVGWRGPADLGY